MSWFGPSWGAPICDPDEHVSTPAGRSCLHCGKTIVVGDQGLVSPFVRVVEGVRVVTSEPTHLDCFMRAILPCPGCPNCKPEKYH